MKSNKLKVIGKFSRRGIIFQELHTSRKIVVSMFFSIYEVEDGPKETSFQDTVIICANVRWITGVFAFIFFLYAILGL